MSVGIWFTTLPPLGGVTSCQQQAKGNGGTFESNDAVLNADSLFLLLLQQRLSPESLCLCFANKPFLWRGSCRLLLLRSGHCTLIAHQPSSDEPQAPKFWIFRAWVGSKLSGLL
jgi:hypothetical protein